MDAIGAGFLSLRLISGSYTILYETESLIMNDSDNECDICITADESEDDEQEAQCSWTARENGDAEGQTLAEAKLSQWYTSGDKDPLLIESLTEICGYQFDTFLLQEEETHTANEKKIMPLVSQTAECVLASDDASLKGGSDGEDDSWHVLCEIACIFHMTPGDVVDLIRDEENFADLCMTLNC